MSQAPALPQPAPETRALRVASWNLQSCRRGLPGIVARLRSLEADLVALQEVDRCTERSSCVDQTALLAREAGFAHHLFFPALDRDGGEYGIALLSRHPLQAPALEKLPVPEGIEPRIVGRARLALPEGGLTVAVTHLSHRIGRRRLRGDQARQILSLLAEHQPFLLLGDFNDVPGSPMHRALTADLVDLFAAAGVGPGGTHHPLGPLLPAVRIDYLFASPKLVAGRTRVLRTRASDHHVLVADLQVPAAAPALRPAVGQ